MIATWSGGFGRSPAAMTAWRATGGGPTGRGWGGGWDAGCSGGLADPAAWVWRAVPQFQQYRCACSSREPHWVQ
jgi:hypothetical protein